MSAGVGPVIVARAVGRAEPLRPENPRYSRTLHPGVGPLTQVLRHVLGLR